jgi:hypothetical protein
VIADLKNFPDWIQWDVCRVGGALLLPWKAHFSIHGLEPGLLHHFRPTLGMGRPLDLPSLPIRVLIARCGELRGGEGPHLDHDGHARQDRARNPAEYMLVYSRRGTAPGSGKGSSASLISCHSPITNSGSDMLTVQLLEGERIDAEPKARTISFADGTLGLRL